MLDKNENSKSDSVNFRPPDINCSVACISSDQFLAAQISSFFNTDKEYFSLLEPPRTLHKYWRNDFIQLNNVLARIKPEKVIIAGVTGQMLYEVRKQLKYKKNRYEFVNSLKDLELLFEKYKDNCEGLLSCPPDSEKIAHALLEAKRKKLRLIIAKDSIYEVKTLTRKFHLVACDSKEKIVPILVANYAFSIDADIVFFNPPKEYSPFEIYAALSDLERGGTRSRSAKKVVVGVKANLTTEIKDIIEYNFVTFFTEDLLYGHFFQSIPATHIFNKLLVGQFLSTSIKEPNIRVNSAVLVDTGFFKDSETDDISSSLARKSVLVKELRDDQFTNLELDFTVAFYPYDFLFICSHGEFPSGQRFEIQFADKNAVEHLIVIDTLDSFMPTGKGVGRDQIIDVQTVTEFVELDGKPWYQKTYKPGSSKTIVEDFMAIERKKWNVISKRKVGNMRFANAITTKSKLGPYVPMLHSISDPSSVPFVFNNTCISTYTLAVNFIAAGASFYIGTVNKVGVTAAVEIAKQYFVRVIDNGEPLSMALWKSQSDSSIAIKDRVYACVGCHFKKFDFDVDGDSKSRLIYRIKRDVYMRYQRVKDGKGGRLEKFTREKHKDVIRFLLKEGKALGVV